MLLFLFFSLVWALLLLWVSDPRKEKYKVVLPLAAILLYWGFSFTNAPDTEGYMDFFDAIYTSGWVLDSLVGSAAGGMEPGVFILMQLCKKLSGSYYFFQFVVLTIDLVLTYWGLRNLLKNKMEPIVFLLIITFCIPLYLSALRQGVAIALMVFCLPLFRDNRFYIYIPLILLGIFFHQSAILLFAIPILMFLFKRINLKKDFGRILFLIIFLVCNFCYFAGISAGDYIERIFGGFVYDSSLSTNREMSIGQSMEGSDFGILKVLEMDVCFIIFYLSSIIKKNGVTKYMGAFFLAYFILNMLVGGIIIHRLTYYLRLPYYFILFETLRGFMMNRMKLNYKVSNLIVYLYMFFIFMVQSGMSSTYIYEYHLFDIF